MMRLSDKTGRISAFLWDNVEENLGQFRMGDYVTVKGLVREYNSHLQLTVYKIKKLTDSEVDPSDFLPMTSEDVEIQFSELMQHIQALKNKHLRVLLLSIMADAKISNKFKRAPAAKKIHHAYLGGLLDHTLSLVRLCHLVVQNYPLLNVDLLVAGAILHDIGKIEELTYERTFNYSDEGKLLGHIVMETTFVNQAINQLPEFPQELRLQLLHMLISHHGKHEFGSPQVPKTLEAMVLHHLDDLDGKIETMRSLIFQEDGDANWSSYSQSLERYVYRRRLE